MTSRDLIKAARVKIQVGWVQGTPLQMRGGVPHYCLLGALNHTAFGAALPTRRQIRLWRVALARLTRVVRAQHPPVSAENLTDETAVMCFNDHLFTDQAQVLALMDEAAEGK